MSTTYFFDEDKAKGVCDRYMEVAAVHKADHQADVDGFWRVLRSAGGQQKLRVQPSPPSATPGLSPEGRYRG